MSEPAVRSGSTASAPVVPVPAIKVRATKGPETVINPERRPGGLSGSASGAPAAGSGEAGTSGTPVTPQGKSSILRALFPADETQAELPFEPSAERQLGHFAIVDRIRTGGMGAVFRARDTRLNRIVALKVLPPGMSRDPLIVQRFKNEGQAAAQLDHENVARVYFIGEEHGLHYIAFEFINGTNVRDLILQQGQLSVSDSLNYVLQIASALVHTSAQGVIHRDIKPSNIIITHAGRAKLVDLGLARKETKEDQAVDLTIAGTTLGTFDYISPEQARDPRSADVRSDIYSLGCTLYHMLTGEPPYPEGTVLQKLLQHQGDEAPDPAAKNRHVPENLSVVVRKMMAKDPRRRYQSAELLVRDLILVAGSLGLRSVSPEGLVWQAVQPDRMSFWERHFAWIITASLLLLIAGFLEYGPVTLFQPSGAPDERETADAGTAGKSSPEKTAGRPEATESSSASSGAGPGTEVADAAGHSGRGTPERREPAATDDRTGTGRREGSDTDDADAAPVQRIRPVPLATDRLRSGEGSEQFASAVERPESLDGPEEPGSGSPGLVARIPNESEPLKTTDTARPGETVTTTAGTPDRGAKDPPAVLPASEDEGIFVLGKDAASNRRYATLELACASIRDNGAIIELRFNGRRRESMVRINRKVTIRAAKGFRPVLEFQPSLASIEDFQARAIWMPSGSLDLVGVDLVLAVDATAPAENWSLFSLEHPDLLQMERVTVTIVNPSRRRAAVFELRTPAGALMPDMPVVGGQPRSPLKVEVNETLVRGDADLFVARHAEPARLAVDKSIVALQGSLFAAYGHSESNMGNAQIELRLDHVTSVLGTGLVRFDVGSLPRKLLPLQVSATNCIFSNNATAPFVEMTGNAPPQDFRELLQWSGQNNFYDRYATLWLIASMEETGARSDPWDAAAWRRWSEATETNPHFGPVIWSRRSWTTRPLGDLVPADFALDHDAPNNPPVGAANFRDAGADLDVLRAPAAGE